MALQWGIPLSGNFCFCVSKRPLKKIKSQISGWIFDSWPSFKGSQSATQNAWHRAVNRGTRTIRLGRGFCEVASPPPRTRSEKSKCGSQNYENAGVEEIRMKKKRKHFSPPLCSLVVGKPAQDRGTFRPIRITGLWTCTAFGATSSSKA